MHKPLAALKPPVVDGAGETLWGKPCKAGTGILASERTLVQAALYAIRHPGSTVQPAGCCGVMLNAQFCALWQDLRTRSRNVNYKRCVC